MIKKFGCIPLANLQVPNVDKSVQGTGSPIKNHNVIVKSGVPNFMGEQILVPSQFNIPLWEKDLTEYWDKQLLF